MRPVARVLLASLLCILAACTTPGTPAPGVAPRPTAIPATNTPPPPPAATTPAPTATATLAPTHTPVPAATLAAALATALATHVAPTPVGGPGIEGISVAPLVSEGMSVPAGQSLWVAWSYGLRSFETNQLHFVAIYSAVASGSGQDWHELARLDLETADYLDQQGALKQVQVAPGSIWLELHSGAGAHGGCFDLLRFDGQNLTQPVEQCTGTPGGGSSTISDVNGDGTPDVVLDDTDAYVFCYACGVRLYQWRVLQWNGADFEEVKLTPLPDSAPADLREPLNRAVALAGGELWKDAQALALQAEALKPTDPLAVWDIALIKFTAESRADPGPFPLLGHIFYGDYAAALDVMRAYPVDQLFQRPSPLTTADQMWTGWETDLSRWITTFTTKAIAAEPKLAAAYFLRGWAEYQMDPQDPAALADLQKAAELEPQETLFTESLAQLP